MSGFAIDSSSLLAIVLGEVEAEAFAARLIEPVRLSEGVVSKHETGSTALGKVGTQPG